MSTEVLTLLVAIAMAVGLAGSVLPVLPGLFVIWAAALLFGLVDGFGTLGIIVMVFLTAAVLASLAISVMLPARTAEAAGASRYAQWFGLVGAVIGFFAIPVLGAPVGLAVGVLVSEYIRLNDLGQAWAATKGAIKGLGISALIDLLIGIAMVVAWAIWAVNALG